MRVRGVPLLAMALAALGGLMLVPALFAAVEQDWRAARFFLYSAIFVGFFAAIWGAAAHDPRPERAGAQTELMAILGFFAWLPVFAAIPIWLLHPALGAEGAYFEAVSAMTTTGATLFDRPQESHRAVQLWRAMLGWAGGLATLTAAAAVLLPRGLTQAPGASQVMPESARAGRVVALVDSGGRTLRALRRIAPIYGALTAALALAFLASGAGDGLAAAAHAMGVVSTSGISPLDGGFAALDNRWAEAAALAGMILAASRLIYRRQIAREGWRAWTADPEMQLLALTAAICAGWLFVRHWIGALTLTEAAPELRDTIAGGFVALWGAAMTCISFLTTTGYVSADWAAARYWSGLDTPTLMLLGLAAMGGGVASTAGGLKLFRAYALFRHGSAELARMVHPHMIETARTPAGRLTRADVMNAWVYMALFLAAMATGTALLTLTEAPFALSLEATIAALSNTGPALVMVTGDPAAYKALAPEARLALCGAMILGRIEILAFVALLNPGALGGRGG